MLPLEAVRVHIFHAHFLCIHIDKEEYEQGSDLFEKVAKEYIRKNVENLCCFDLPSPWRLCPGVDSVIWLITKAQINDTSIRLAILYDTERKNKYFWGFYTAKFEIQF